MDCKKRIPGHVERVGLFGGTFDPIHLGHLILAQAALEELDLDRLIFIPAAISPYKGDRPPSVSAADRLEMIRHAIQGEDRFSVDDRELQREGPSYTIETVRSLLGDYPGVRFIYLIGADNVAELSGWQESEELKNLIDFAVFTRAETSEETMGDFPLIRRRIDISSTEIRERLAKGHSVRYFLPSLVQDYITTHRLYRSTLPNDQVQA
jgi:nicotinate-nucleotide adenylyltransferase